MNLLQFLEARLARFPHVHPVEKMQLLITLKDLTFVVYVVENKHQVSKNESKIRWLLQNTHERVVRSYDQLTIMQLIT